MLDDMTTGNDDISICVADLVVGRLRHLESRPKGLLVYDLGRLAALLPCHLQAADYTQATLAGPLSVPTVKFYTNYLDKTSSWQTLGYEPLMQAMVQYTAQPG